MPLSLAFREYGSGPPLVILHGLFGSQRNWQSMAEWLASHYRVFACDLRNHGDSPWAPSMRFEEMADDLEALIEEKGLAPATVLGHSVGGKTAMLTALRHPDVVDALIVVDIAPGRLRGAVPRLYRGDAGGRSRPRPQAQRRRGGAGNGRCRMSAPDCSCCRTWKSARPAASPGG